MPITALESLRDLLECTVATAVRATRRTNMKAPLRRKSDR
jgi:hypothetical protein